MTARRRISAGLLLAIAAIGPREAVAQGPTVSSASASVPGSTVSRMGRIPGTGGGVFANEPGADQMILGGGRPGPSFPRVQPSPNMGQGMGGRLISSGITAPVKITAGAFPVYGPLALPTAAEDEGPADGLTLDQALDRVVLENFDLRSRFLEIPQAEADVLTAGLRANPILFADAQLVPYGKYTRDRPGGATQSDVNISHPFDISGKRRARTLAARRIENVIEAQYQDAVRIQIDNLYTLFVDILAARETVRLAKASVEGLDRLLEVTETLYKKADATSVDVGRVRVQRLSAEVGLDDARENLRRSKHGLATLLNIPADQAESLEIQASIAPPAVNLPSAADLVQLALETRPDLIAHRLGVGRSRAEVDLARAERFQDVYLLFQPYTFQDNAPIGAKSATSWALGATVPVPLFNRNQGAILRSRLNVHQTVIELSALEQHVVNEVVQAERAYSTTRAILKRTEQELLPASRRMRDDALELFTSGELEAAAFFERQRWYNEDVRRYRDTLVRHRRGTLRLNTAVGRRILP